MTSKYITILYATCGIIFIILPFIFYAFDLPRDEWMLPLTLHVFFINSKAHPGYEITFVVSAYLVNTICLLIAGNIYNYTYVGVHLNRVGILFKTKITNAPNSRFSFRFDNNAFVFLRVHSTDHL